MAKRLQVLRGACLQAVVPGGAAAQAGLLPTRRGLTGITPGDVILAVEGRQVSSGADLINALDQYQPGDEVALRVGRSGEPGGTGPGGQLEIDVQVKLGEEP